LLRKHWEYPYLKPNSTLLLSLQRMLRLGGALMSWVVGYIDPVEFGVSASLRHITFIVIGGMGSIYGSF
jgi:hypothetical protein